MEKRREGRKRKKRKEQEQEKEKEKERKKTHRKGMSGQGDQSIPYTGKGGW